MGILNALPIPAKNNRFMKKALLAIIILGWLYLPMIAHSQSVPVPTPETPNVASFDKFGDIPVDLATGVPNISVPIHTVHYGNINVPISLRYHPASLRLSAHPSWVGTGWDLESGGAITRSVRGYPDEFYGSAQVLRNQQASYYPWPVSNPPTSGAQVVYNGSSWSTLAGLKTYFTGNDIFTDVCADEFSFSFMGHSGKFYYTPSGWQVVSDENIQVQLNQTPLLTSNAVVSTITNEFSAYPTRFFPSSGISGINLDPAWATYVFTGFVLTVPDGTKYYFGGVNAGGNGIGIEFYTQYPLPTANLQFNTNTWLLTKIVDVDGNEVDFNYSASYCTADIGFGYNADSWSCQQTSGGFLGSVYGSGWAYSSSVDILRHGGNLYIPLYLDNITCPDETVTFNRQQATCLRFTDLTYEEMDLGGSNVPANYFNLSILGENVTVNGITINPAQNLQWMQLNSISIANGNGQPYKNYQFNYSNSTSQRLTLNSLQELDNTNTSIQKYSFTYNNIGNLPLYDGNYSDHWGFYNGMNISAASSPSASDATSGSIFSFRVTDPVQVLTGLLTQINYPTGGYSKLTWQPHDYSQYVTSTSTVSRQTLNNTTGTAYAGCCRIGEIQSFLADGTPAHDKKYLYVQGYSNSSPTGNPSSGVLDGIPTYTMTLNNRSGIDGTTNENISVTMLNSLAAYSYNSEGNYVDYTQVVELNEDGSYTKNYFTSYGADGNGVSHWDMQPLASAGWLPTDNYYSTSDLSVERGKLYASYKYAYNDVLVQSTWNWYRTDAARFNNYVRLINFNGSYSGCAAYDALVLATANQKFNYDYYIASTETTTYDQNGQNPISTTTSYQYNSNNLVNSKTEMDSKGEVVGTSFLYPPDMTDATSQAMTAAHILSPVVQSSVGVNYALVAGKQVNYYSPASGIFKPQSLQEQVGTNPIETRQSFYNYDSHGNLQEASKTNDIHDVYLWGYFRQYPVAKISGSTLSAVTAIVSQAQIDALTNTTTATNDASVRNLLQGLRTGLPNALVTTYTYLPLTGITSETDPKGLTTYYQYDNFQRLRMVTDNDGNVLKTYNYQYQTPQ
jgi:YD repeat-containing protein